MEPIEVRLHREKETMRNWRYEADEVTAPVRYVYVRKDALPEDEVPIRLVVTIEADDVI